MSRILKLRDRDPNYAQPRRDAGAAARHGCRGMECDAGAAGEHGGGHRRAMLAGAGGEQPPAEDGGAERGTEPPRARVPHAPQAA